jgi:hypothetical protein
MLHNRTRKLVPLQQPLYLQQSAITWWMTQVMMMTNKIYRDVLVYTTSEILKIGLGLIGYKEQWIKRASRKTTLWDFKGAISRNMDLISRLYSNLGGSADDRSGGCSSAF